jgi:hypothetical protein
MIQNIVNPRFWKVEEPQTSVPFSDYFSTLIIHTKIFKQIFLKLFF